MDKERIERGDIVNVHFTTSTSIFRAKVMSTPEGPCDFWALLLRVDEPINVVLFERMDLVRKGTPK